MKFSEVIGQQEALKHLRDLAEEQRVPHAILFTGPEGSGKIAIALAFASYLLGDRDDENNNRQAEAMLRKCEHPDLHFTYPTIKGIDLACLYNSILYVVIEN